VKATDFTYHHATDPAVADMLIRSAVARPVRVLAVAYEDNATPRSCGIEVCDQVLEPVRCNPRRAFA
jgi:hypothetical protein